MCDAIVLNLHRILLKYLLVKEMCDNQNCCRICLDLESNHVSILGDPTINLQLRSCLAIIVSANDHLPKDICVTCVSQLNQFYNFQLNARCSQDWLESSLQVKAKKNAETKTQIQPLPDSEYNSDSLLEFLNNTANIEDYLNNLGKEDIPSIVNMLDRNEHAIELGKVINFKTVKQPSPKKNEIKSKNNIDMEIDVLDSDIDIVKEIIMKEVDPKSKPQTAKIEKNFITCYGCKVKFDSIQKLCQHVSTCDNASRTCVKCDSLFDSRQKMIEHSAIHSLPLTCHCEQQFASKEKLSQHQKICRADYGANLGCVFKCRECGDMFRDRFQLYRHARAHIIKAEEKKCDVCGHIFTGNDALIKHKKKEHEKPEGTMYRCKVCSLTLPDHDEMYLHVKKHTTKQASESSRHLCESCGKSFSTRAILMRHTLQHNNKDYKCIVCCKYYNNQKEKDEHMVEHSEIAMCERCGNTVNCYQFEMHSCI